MNTNISSPFIKDSSFKLDPTSDRYRVCPNDGVEFMAKHGSKIYCSDKCADDFHNKKKKEAREKKMQAEAFVVNTAIKPADNINTTESVVKPEAEAPDSGKGSYPAVSPLFVNISLLSQTLGKYHRLSVHEKYLTEKGFIYEAFDHKYRFKDTGLFILTYGPYAIAWTYQNIITITYKNQLKWMPQ